MVGLASKTSHVRGHFISLLLVEVRDLMADLSNLLGLGLSCDLKRALPLISQLSSGDGEEVKWILLPHVTMVAALASTPYLLPKK